MVTAISGNVSNGILKVLADTEDTVFGCDINDYPVGMDKVEDFWRSDLAVSPCYIGNLLKKCKEYEITHLIPVNEIEIQVVSDNIQKFKNEDIKVIVNEPKIVDVFLDKYQTWRFLKKIEGISIPETFKISDFKGDGTPYIVKPRKGCGSKFLKLITNESELASLNINDNEYIVQKYIDAPEDEYTVGVFSDMLHISTIIFKRKLEHGYTSFVELIRDDTIVEIAEMIAEKIQLKGFINIQLRKYKNKNYIFEINPRISGTVYFRHMLDFTDVLWWLDLSDSKTYSYSMKYSKAVGMRELNEKFVFLEANS